MEDVKKRVCGTCGKEYSYVIFARRRMSGSLNGGVVTFPEGVKIANLKGGEIFTYCPHCEYPDSWKIEDA